MGDFDMPVKGTILLTGYEAFGDFSVNPSIAACRNLEGKEIEGYKISVEEITMKFDSVKAEIEGHLENYRPAATICTGVSGAGGAAGCGAAAGSCCRLVVLLVALDDAPLGRDRTGEEQESCTVYLHVSLLPWWWARLA